MRRLRKSAALAALLLCLGGPLPALEAPAQQQAILLLRGLAYDHNLRLRSGDEVVVVVLYRSGLAESELCAVRLVDALRDLAIDSVVQGLRIRAESVRWTGTGPLASTLTQRRTSALYVCAGMEDAVPALSDLARSHQTLTVAGRREDIEAGLSVGFVVQDGRTRLLVNLRSVRAEGAELDASLLRIAEVLR